MRFRWLLLLSSFLSIFLASLPAQARQLLSWRFDRAQNRLVFTTDEGVQPQAQLIADPTRVVIDLPGIILERPTASQQVGGAIKEVRVGQFNDQTTRIVIELAPGYTVDPQGVKFEGASPRQWSVELPTPQRVTSPPNRSPVTPPPRSQAPEPRPSEGTATSGTRLDSFRVTRDGFFIRTSGEEPERIEVKRSRDRRRIDIDLEGATLSSNLGAEELAVNRYGVSQIQFSQASTSPPVVRMTLNVSRESPDWQASFSRVGGIVVLPQGTTTGRLENPPRGSDNPRESPTRPVPPVRNNRLTTIESVELGNDGTQLLIRADQAVQATNTWDRQANAYRITISGAQLAEQVKGPQLDVTSPVSRVQIRQQDARTVVILVQPSAGVRVGELNQPNEQLLALELQRSRVVTPPTSRIPVPPSESIPVPNPNRTTTPEPLPRVPNSRIVVMIDPGHGGEDPGTIGIGGVQEKNIILPISQEVAALLEQQGIQAVLTRSDDRFVSLEGRVQLAQRARANLFVSIHANAINLSRPDINGIETYYYSSGQRLAQTIHNSILQNVDVDDRGVRRARFYVLRNTSMPAALVEVGFVTGREDAAKLADPEFRSQMAAAIARGILQYIQQNS